MSDGPERRTTDEPRAGDQRRSSAPHDGASENDPNAGGTDERDDTAGADGSTTEASPEDESVFDDDFATAFGAADAGGFESADRSANNGPTGDSTTDREDFDSNEEDFDSAIPRVDVGIDGLDEMIRGGVPARSLIAVIGSAGTGKTTVGLQFLRRALENDEKAIFIALEESRRAVLDTAEEKGWGFERYCENERLAVVDLDPVEMATSLTGIRSELPGLIEEFDASRVVLDSVSLLETMYDDPAKRRTEIFAFARSLKQAGVTTLLTSEAAVDTAYASRYGIVEYLTDAVFVLQYVRPSDFQETRLAVEIQKIRNASHSRETKPYEITNEGISVYRRANIF